MRFLTAFCLAAASFSAYSGQAFHPLADNLTYGSVSNHQSLVGHTNNPAVGASSLDMGDWFFGMGVFSSVGVGAEVGPVDNFTEQVDALKDKIDNFSGDSIDAVNEIKTQFDDFLVQAGDSGSAQVSSAVQIPLFPLVWSSRGTLGGSLVFDSNLSAIAKLRILDRPIEFNPLEQGTNVLQTNTAVYFKVGAVAEASLGYSRPILELDEGALHAGVRGKYYRVELRKSVMGLSEMQDDAVGALNDELSDIRNIDPLDIQSAYGLDFGVLWTTRNYRLGGWVKNANSPSFEYASIGTGCENIVNSVSEQNGCFIERSFANEIDLEETYVMDAQISLEGAVYSNTRNFVASASLDTSPVNDPLGNQIQWATASIGYATTSWIMPGVRAGYRKNLAGSQLSALTFGVTLFKMLNIDMAYGLESVKIDDGLMPGPVKSVIGTNAPRFLQINAGISVLF